MLTYLQHHVQLKVDLVSEDTTQSVKEGYVLTALRKNGAINEIKNWITRRILCLKAL